MIIPDRLLEAREYLGFTREQAAVALGTEPLALADMENGSAEPTEVMLAKMGQFYRRPLAWFSGESRFEPSPGLLRRTENLHPGDREAILEFAEWLQGAGAPPKPDGSRP